MNSSESSSWELQPFDCIVVFDFDGQISGPNDVAKIINLVLEEFALEQIKREPSLLQHRQHLGTFSRRS